MSIGINLWDDYNEDEETYIYVEAEVSEEDEKIFLETILPHIDEKYKPHIFFYRAIDQYPDVREKFKDDPGTLKYFLESERWEIRLSILWDDCDSLVEKLNGIKFKTNFHFYSES